ncbi:MAG TPA: metal ABC transporter permease [Propionibacteriaceae bacterium]|nr:metal ABC transporter permease [Propionibacteriaceae bacterium]
MDIISLPFMQRALLAAMMSGLISPAIGTWIVQRRMSLLGDGLGHVAIAGVGLAFLTGTSPLPLAVGVTIAGAVLVEYLRQKGRATGDVGLAVLFYGGLASGVLMAGLAGQGAGALSQYLFGSLTTVTSTDLWTVAILAIVVLVPSIGLAPQLFAVSADEEYARAQGLPVRALNMLIVVLAAITVTISMRTVGLLLVSAMMVIPVATAQHVFGSFRASHLGGLAIGGAVAVLGTLGSYQFDSASGATIVVFAIAVFVLSLPLSALLHRHSPGEPEPVEDDDDHVVAESDSPHHDLHAHDPECEHPAILHEDHVDYLHDGHRHAPHGDHFDEH